MRNRERRRSGRRDLGARAVTVPMTSPGQPDDFGRATPTADVASPAVPSPRVGAERIDDGAVPERLKAGDVEALATVYQRTSPLVFTIALRALSSEADAEDVTQRVYLQAWRSRGAYDPARRPIRAWLVGIARRVVADKIGERSGHTSLEQRLDEVGRVEQASDDGIAWRVADAVVVADGVSRLEQPRRQVLEMSFFQGLTHTQISKMLGMPVGAVKSDIKRGLAELRRQLGASDGAS
jgi:RNA polymerase sigma-70 factor (ECF subfamily)